MHHAYWAEICAKRRASDRGKLAVGGLGLLVSICLHALLIGAVVWGSSGPAHPARMHEGLGANAFGSTDDTITTLFFVEESSAPADHDPQEDLASAGKILQSLHVTILGPDPSIDAALKESSPDNPAPATEEQSAGEREAKAAIFGRYIGQIQARVNRAWLRPRTPIGAESFECRARVLQSAQGDVQEVMLQDCNGSPQWQISLVRAIERASPLPAPPDPAVFASSILLSFTADPWRSASEPSLYDPEVPQPTVAGLSRLYLSEGR